MSKDWVQDIAEMHTKFTTNEHVRKMNNETLKAFLTFRVGCLQEELDELKVAIVENDADGVVDAITDLLVFGIGTLDVFEIDAHKAWQNVLEKNLEKNVGQKETRANKFGFPDLIKPIGWQPPNHKDNIGLLDLIFEKKE